MKRIINNIGLALSLLVISSNVVALPSLKDLEKMIKSGEKLVKGSDVHLKALKKSANDLVAIQKELAKPGISAADKMSKCIEGINIMNAALNEHVKPMLAMTKDVVSVTPAKGPFDTLDTQVNSMAEFSKELAAAMNEMKGVLKVLGAKPATAPAPAAK